MDGGVGCDRSIVARVRFGHNKADLGDFEIRPETARSRVQRTNAAVAMCLSTDL